MTRIIARFLTFTILFLGGIVVFGRESKSLYSIGNNPIWNMPNSWSFTNGGESCGLIPQSNDTIIINTSVLLNSNFSLTAKGVIRILMDGKICGNAFQLSLIDESRVECKGELQLYDFNIAGHSSFILYNTGKTSVIHNLVNTSFVPSLNSGKLSVFGTLNCGDLIFNTSVIMGSGYTISTKYIGCGETMSIKPTSIIPDGSMLTEVNWTGRNSSNWNDPLNWTSKSVPTENSNISILVSEFQPTLIDGSFSHDLYLCPGTVLIMAPYSSLRITGDLMISETASFKLENTFLAHSSLIILGQVAGKIKAEYPVAENSHSLISSPVTDARSGVFVNMYLREYLEASSGWGSYIVPTDVKLNSMQGYELYSPGTSVRVFEGTPNTGEISEQVTSMNDGWNLIGNPYPSYIDWQSNSKSPEGWQRSNVANAIYYPDPSGSGNYAVYVSGSDYASVNHGSRFIPPMQGFFVKAKQEGVVKVNSMAIAMNGENSEQELLNTAIKFKIEGTSYSDETVVRFNSASTLGFDDDFDAYKLTGTGDAPSIFSTLSDGTKLAVNTMPSLTSTLEIPLGITCNTNDEYKITINGALNFSFRYPIILEDKVTRSFVNLRSDSVYTFAHSKEIDPMRFVIHFEESSGYIENESGRPTVQLIDGNIRISGKDNSLSDIDVFSLDGKHLIHTSGILLPELIIPFQWTTGIYIVKITAKKSTYSCKLYSAQ